ncbi:MAG: hypothetical protein WBG71_09175 [Leeuwenhoekiella sp.]
MSQDIKENGYSTMKEELINTYFERKLSPEEQRQFEELYENDPEFREEVAFREDLKKVVTRQERGQIKERLQQLKSIQQVSPEVNKVRRLYPWVVAAASIAAILVIMMYVVNPIGQQTNYDALYAENFTPYENVVHPIQRGDAAASLETEAFTAYEFNKYEKAAQLFEELQKQSTENYLNFYRGISLMQLNRHQEATKELKYYLSTGGTLDVRAKWYLGLCYLKLDKPEIAQDFFLAVIKAGGFKERSTNNILKQID